MPELPEVETMVRGIRPFVEGRTVKSVVRCRCSCKPISIRPRFELLAKRLVARRIDAVRRLGKRVVLDVSDGSAVVIEPRMTGLMLLSNPPDPVHLRIEWKFSGRAKYNSVWFWDRRGLGTVRLFGPGELERALPAKVLGPDALEMDVEMWRERCRKTSRPIKVLLLDQKCVAGIGNLYASEILHRAKIHPARPARRLKPKEIQRLSDETHAVLEEAILHEGSTLGDATYRTVLNNSGQYQNKHLVYDRAGEPCLTCGEALIRRIVQAQRSTFFCPVCQRR
ncbi:MAG TPA: bifunctional DNA-formamidopyrimidine glycosylase/DNA-(apurinic or apyrimidinic site) lyase [Planctomycetaceae bacterium]|jgi:formamidopyrimidine-DNA glycosylase|nr:bifunctional DNA-formamidopyrimidine glycosylase/DNA-(apurinic or apyrimidinic site) lyase [Planctomycetaceae bacterium]